MRAEGSTGLCRWNARNMQGTLVVVVVRMLMVVMMVVVTQDRGLGAGKPSVTSWLHYSSSQVLLISICKMRDHVCSLAGAGRRSETRREHRV